MYSEQDFIWINLLQHYRFCPRQCALIAIEDAWRDNSLTIGGMLLHEKVDEPETTVVGDVERITSLRIHSYRYGLTGKCDVVERRRTTSGIEIVPVEYKAGMPKKDLSDNIQLCAQALCLEEMLDCTIDRGEFFYGKIRRRVPVQIDQTLRTLTIETIAAVRQLIETQHLPPADYAPKCRSCSLRELCQPKASNSRRVRFYLQRLFNPSDNAR